MKTSEMIAMLEKNPKLKFISNYGYTVAVDTKNELITDRDNYLIVNLKRDWQLVREPVTWQEALQAWVDGKTIKCEYPPNDMKLISTTFFPKNLTSTPTREALITGTWYID